MYDADRTPPRRGLVKVPRKQRAVIPNLLTSPSVIQGAVTIPVMANASSGHFVEAQILEALQVDFIDESEVLTPADDQFHIDKHAFTVPFVFGARNLGEALRRIAEGAAMILSGGGSATIGRLLRRFELDLPIVDRIARGMSTFGTCEGLILMAKAVISGGPPPWPGWT